MRKTTIVFVELGMIGGIIIAGYRLPGDTRLSTFLVSSGVCFALGNVALIAIARRERPANKEKPSNASAHFLRAFIILAIGWLLVFLLRKL